MPAGEGHRPGRAAGERRPALDGRRRSPSPTGDADERLRQVARLAARQVDEVGLADRLDVGRVVGVEPVADEDRLDLGAERREVLDAHRRPAPEDVLAVGPGRGRQDHDARPPAARRGQERRVDLAHRGQELAGSDEGDRSRSRHAA